MNELKDYKEIFAKPFGPDEIKFKVQKKYENDSKALVVAYVDARAVMDRLDESGATWSDDYFVHAEGIVCKLTVNGVTRTDVGENAESGAIDQSMKTGFSDAFKRAAVKFGIGRHLYSLPRLNARVVQVGRTWIIDKDELPRLYDAIRGVSQQESAIDPNKILAAKLLEAGIQIPTGQIVSMSAIAQDSGEQIWNSWSNYVKEALVSGKNDIESADFANGKYKEYMEKKR